MKIKRVMIAVPKSGSGKTIVTCALLQTLKNSGVHAVSYKCGPDYIDPMFHEKAIGVPSGNLDTFFTGEEQTRRLFLKGRTESDFVVLEGVMGLYDGQGGIRQEGSSYHLAKVTETPIVLVADVKGMGRSMIPMLAGFLAYDKEHLIRGVLLNRISKGYYETAVPLIEEELKIPVVGFLPEKEGLHIESRYLGLVVPDEPGGMREKLRTAADEFQKTVSLKKIVRIAENAQEIGNKTSPGGQKPWRRLPGPADTVTIAVAQDEAFCFYYKENLRLLEERGAQIRYFSPLRDEKLPDGSHGLLFGGGYPELYAKELCRNRKMREAVREASKTGMPVVAECGGFLYLHSTLTDREGACYDMAGVIPAGCYDTGKSVRFGYIELRERQRSFLPANTAIKGHEFHYYDSSDNGADGIAAKPATGKTYPCMIVDETHWMGFPHLYYPSNPKFAEAFVEKARRYKSENINFL